MPASWEPIVILGPTATGKSDLALILAGRLGGRIINADSIQVYRGLDVGSAKPSLEARRAVRHELIDVADPADPYSAGRFAREASEAIEAARLDGSIPIVAGGTGLYLRALLHGIAPMPQRDEAVRKILYDRAASTSPEEMHRELMELDPETAERLGPRDLSRVVRALEVLALSGVPLSRHIKDHAFETDRLPSLKVGLTMPREALYRRTDDRVDRIFASGIVEEVRGLLDRGVPAEANALKALGYREVVAHLRGELDMARTIELVKRNTRRYARRQIIWFRREPNVNWFDVSDTDGGLEAIADSVIAMRTRRHTGG